LNWIRRTEKEKGGIRKMKKGEIKTLSLMAMLLLSIYLNSVPLASAAYTIDDFEKYMPPDLPCDINYDGKVDLGDVFAAALAFGSFPGHQIWNRWADLNTDGKVDLRDYFAITLNYGKVENLGAPIAYSTTFEFTVPEDGDKEVWYYILALYPSFGRVLVFIFSRTPILGIESMNFLSLPVLSM